MARIRDTGQPAFDKALADIVEALQEQRSALVLAVRDVQLNAGLLVLEEARRLKAERGPDDVRVTRYEHGRNVFLRRLAALEVEAQIAAIRVPPVARTDALLQGRVTDEASRAIAHVSVILADADNKPLADVPTVETDDAGYYAFVLGAAQTAAIGPERRLALLVGSSSGKVIVPGAAMPVTLAPGKTVAADLRLQPGELEVLGLQPAFGTVQPEPEAAAPAGGRKPPADRGQAARPKKKP